MLLTAGGDHHLLLVVVLLHHQALLELLQHLLCLDGSPAVWPAGGLTEPALRPALLAVLSDQRLQLCPGQLLLRGQDGPRLTARQARLEQR